MRHSRTLNLALKVGFLLILIKIFMIIEKPTNCIPTKLNHSNVQNNTLLKAIMKSREYFQWCRENHLDTTQFTQYADKHWIKQFVKNVAPGLKTADEYYYANSSVEITDDLLQMLPQTYVFKPNHLWAETIVVRNGTPHCYVRKGSCSKCDRQALKLCLVSNCKKWLDSRHGLYDHQLHYRYIPPKCIFEEFIGDDGKLPIDFKVGTFHGIPYFVCTIDTNMNGTRVFDYYTPSWDRINVNEREPFKREERQTPLEKPVFLDEMLKYAQLLGKPFKMLRVDFFGHGKTFSFAEFSPTPNACKGTLVPIQVGKFYGYIADNPHLDINPEYVLEIMNIESSQIISDLVD